MSTFEFYYKCTQNDVKKIIRFPTMSMGMLDYFMLTGIWLDNCKLVYIVRRYYIMLDKLTKYL